MFHRQSLQVENFGFCFFFFRYSSFFFFNFYCYSITVVCLFSPSLHPTPGEPTSFSHLHPPPWFCPCVLYSSSCNPLLPLSPPHSSLAIVRLFLTSMSLVIFYLLFSFVDSVRIVVSITACHAHTIFLKR